MSIVNHFSELVSPEKQLRGGVTFVDKIPKNQTGKILRKELRAKYENEISNV